MIHTMASIDICVAIHGRVDAANYNYVHTMLVFVMSLSNNQLKYT